MYRKIPVGIICSILGAAAAFYLSLVTVLELPPAGAARWLAITGLAALSILGALLINGVSVQDFRKLSQDLRETSNLYRTLTSRLSPLLYGGIEDVLQRRVKSLELPQGLNFSVYAPIRGVHRLVASTFQQSAPIRQIELEPDEGFTGFIMNRQVPAFALAAWQVKPPSTGEDPSAGGGLRDVFDRSGRLIGRATPLREVNKGKIDVGEKWVYGRPIFERSAATPWSNRVVGLLLVHSGADNGDLLFKDGAFQSSVDSLASDVAPYLDVLQTLLAEGE